MSCYSYFHMQFMNFSFLLYWTRTRTQRKGSIKRIDRCFSSWQCDFICGLERLLLLLLGCDYTASCCDLLICSHLLCCCRLFCCCCRCRWLSLSFAFQNKNSKSPEGGHTPALARPSSLSVCVCVACLYINAHITNKQTNKKKEAYCRLFGLAVCCVLCVLACNCE